MAALGLELLLTAFLAGGVAGWWLGRTPRAMAVSALAGLVFAIGPGHNIPLLGSSPAAAKGLLLLLAIVATGAWVLVQAEAWLAR